MGEAVPPWSPDEPGDNPDLRLCEQGSQKLFSVEDILDEPHDTTEFAGPWPDVELELSEQNLFGSSTLPTNPDARLRTVINALRETTPEALPVLDKPPLAYRDSLRKFITGPVTIKQQRYARVVFVSLNKVSDELWEILKSSNHPVAQAANMVVRKNQERIKQNLALPESRQARTMSDGVLDQLLQDLLLVTQGEAIRAAFTERLNELKKAK